jgi:hypothetical protein
VKALIDSDGRLKSQDYHSPTIEIPKVHKKAMPVISRRLAVM